MFTHKFSGTYTELLLLDPVLRQMFLKQLPHLRSLTGLVNSSSVPGISVSYQTGPSLCPLTSLPPQNPVGFAIRAVAPVGGRWCPKTRQSERAAAAFCPAQKRIIRASLTLGEKRVSMAAGSSTSMTVRLYKKLDIFFLEKTLLFLTKGLFEA